MASEELPRGDREPQRVVTVRMPRSLHARLVHAGSVATESEPKPSMNRFCVRAIAEALERMPSPESAS